MWGLNIVSQTVQLKTNYWTKIADLGVIISSREVTSYTDTNYCIHILWEVSPSVFLGHPV